MPTVTPEQLRALADEQDASVYGDDETAAALRAAADQLEELQQPEYLAVDELDPLPVGTVVVSANGLIWQRDLVGYPANGQLAWFPLEQEVGSGSDAVGNGARVIFPVQRGDSFE